MSGEYETKTKFFGENRYVIIEYDYWEADYSVGQNDDCEVLAVRLEKTIQQHWSPDGNFLKSGKWTEMLDITHLMSKKQIHDFEKEILEKIRHFQSQRRHANPKPDDGYYKDDVIKGIEARGVTGYAN